MVVCCSLPGSSSLLSTFSWQHVVGVVLFSWASWHHHRAHVAFARLRTSKKGNDSLNSCSVGGNFLPILTTIFPGEPELAGTRMSLFWILLEPRMMKVVVRLEL